MSPHRIASPTRPARAQAAERRCEALRLRQAGYTFGEIGESLGITRQAAHRLVMTALSDLARELRDDAARLRAMEGARLGALLVAVWPATIRAEAWAWDRALRLVATRMRLLGVTAAGPLVNIELGGRAESPALQAARRSLPPLHDVIDGVCVNDPGVNGR